jgi:hypothetical protein
LDLSNIIIPYFIIIILKLLFSSLLLYNFLLDKLSCV